MFDEPGIDVDDVAWIERDQFVYFIEMERQLNDPADWPRFRSGIIEALGAALGICTDVPAAEAHLDDIRSRHDPGADWEGFKAATWTKRKQLTSLGAGERHLAANLIDRFLPHDG